MQQIVNIFPLLCVYVFVLCGAVNCVFGVMASGGALQEIVQGGSNAISVREASVARDTACPSPGGLA